MPSRRYLRHAKRFTNLGRTEVPKSSILTMNPQCLDSMLLFFHTYLLFLICTHVRSIPSHDWFLACNSSFSTKLASASFPLLSKECSFSVDILQMLCIHTLRDKKDIKAICQQKEREKRISLQGYVQHEYSGRITKRALELWFRFRNPRYMPKLGGT